MNTKIFLFLSLLFCSACLKQKNEMPDNYGNDDLASAVNCTLQKVNHLYPAEGTPVLIDSDWIVAATVRADDESGNFFNQLILEDSSGGITILLDEGNLYSRFPIGRKVYLKLKGLYLGNNKGNLQLGAAPAPDNDGIMQVSDVQAKFIGQHLVAAKSSLSLLPIVVAMNELSTPRKDLMNRLITIEEAELDNPFYDNLYAEPSFATSIKLKNCSGAGIYLRSSNYARFQALATPVGRGTITAIYTINKGVGQLSIRDTNDVQFYQSRCDGTSFQEPILLSIDSIRKMYHGKDTVLGNFIIRGIVTSDAANKNFGSSTIILQDGQKGMMVYFGSSVAPLPDLGDSIELKIAGATLTKYEGALEIKNIKASKATVLAKGKTVAPIQLTIGLLNATFSKYESVLVKIINAKITSTGTFGGAKTLSDATGVITLYTSYSATFATTAIPTITKTFQGIATPYNSTNEIKIRNPMLDIY